MATTTWTVTWANSTSMDTLYDPNFTYHYDKVSCMKGAYFAHVVFCYLVFLSGIFACKCVGSQHCSLVDCLASASVQAALPAQQLCACSSAGGTDPVLPAAHM